MRYFDAHAHIQFPEFEDDRAALLIDMQQRGVGALIVGVDRDSSEKAIRLADAASLYAAVGLHPNYTHEEVFDVSAYRTLAQDSRVVAIGECGLDYFRPEDAAAAKPRQHDAFLQHVAIAAELQKPLMVHARPSKGTQDAYHDLIDLLREGKRTYGDALTANIHFFVGGVEEARQLVELGCTVSYTAVLTFTRDYDEAVRYLPLTSILTETDSPYAAPPPNRGTRNDPRAVEAVVEAIAAIRQTEQETVRNQVLSNAQRVFGLA